MLSFVALALVMYIFILPLSSFPKEKWGRWVSVSSFVLLPLLFKAFIWFHFVANLDLSLLFFLDLVKDQE